MRRLRGVWRAIMVVMVGLLSATPALADAPGAPQGLWLTASGNAVVGVTACGGDLCGRIVGLVLAPNEPMPRSWNGMPQCGLTIFRTAPTAEDAGNPAWSGTILDPRNGAHYGARLRVDGNDHLELRGFVGLPLLGQTQRWTRYPGQVPADCRLRKSTA